MSKPHSEPLVYFVRHNFNKTPPSEAVQVVEMLKRKHRFAVLFTPEAFHNWEQYSMKYKKRPSFKRAWKCRQDIKKNGAVVVAQYLQNEYLVGKVKKGSRLKFISPSYAPTLKGLKTLKLHATRRLSHKQNAILSDIKPMYSTISRIRKGAQYVRNAYGVGFIEGIAC